MPELSRTRWACAACLEQYQQREYAGRAAPRDRLRIGVCPRCKMIARTKLLGCAYPAAGPLAPVLERLGRRILEGTQ